MNPGYKQFLLNLVQRCEQRETGVVHLYTASNQYGRLAVAAGTVIHVSLHTTRGMAAVPALAAAVISSHRFEPAVALPAHADLLDTPEVLRQLGAASLGTSAKPALPPAATAEPAAAASSLTKPETTAAAPARIGAAEIQLITMELQQEVGPMADSLVREELRRTHTAPQLAAALAEQLMPAEGQRFLQRVSDLLRLLKLPPP